MNGTRWIAIAATLMCGAWPSWAQLPGPAQQFTFERSHQNSPDLAFYGDTGVMVWSPYQDLSAGAWALTMDGGATWPVKGELPDPPIQFVPAFQPRIVVNSRGTFFAVSRIGRGAGAFWHLFLYRGEYASGAITWTLVTNINATIESEERIDRLWLLCDPATDYLYVFYSRNFTRVEFTRSTDQGVTWSAPEVLSGIPSTGTSVALGPNGELYAVWEDYGAKAVVGRRSLDQGASFSPEFLVAPILDNLSVAPPGWESNENRPDPTAEVGSRVSPPCIALAVDRSDGPHRGRLYAVWAEHADAVTRPPTRGVNEVEPNENLDTAMPIAPGDCVSGVLIDADLGQDCDLFSFEATRGTLLRLYGSLYSPLESDLWGATVFCRHDPDSVFPLAGMAAHTQQPSAPSLYTIPADGTYYLSAGCGGPNSQSYTACLGVMDVQPGSAARDHRDIVMVTSDDGGATWSAKRRVNDDPPYYDNAIPGVGVTPDGVVHVAWYDWRDSGECPSLVSTYWTASRDGGQTFESSHNLHTATFDLKHAYGGGDWRAGDYIRMYGDRQEMWVLWAEPTEPDEVGLADTDIFYARIEPDTLTAVLVDRFAATAGVGRNRLTWWMARGAPIERFVLHRAETEPEGAERQVAEVRVEPGRQDYEVDDAGVVAGRGYRYRLEAVMADGSRRTMGTAAVTSAGGALELGVAPNPFRAATTMTIAGLEHSGVEVQVLDVAGRLVRRFEAAAGVGPRSLPWDGRGEEGNDLPAGIYLIRAAVDRQTRLLRVVKMP